MPQYPFLSPQWIEEAKKVRERFRDQSLPLQIAIRMNQIVTDLPFGSVELKTYIDSSKGYLDIELGELDKPDLSVTLDYQTARSLFIDMDPRAGMEAFIAGKIKVSGDLSKLMSLQNSLALSKESDEAAVLIREITAL